MKTIIGFLKQKWVIQLLIVALFSGLIWFFGEFISFGQAESLYTPLETPFNRLVAILILALVWGLNNIRSYAGSIRIDRQIMADIIAPSAGGDPDLGETHDGIGILRQNLDEALSILKETRSKGKFDTHYLYDIPWYIIIGPPGSGKTTALFNSGLNFPLQDEYGTKEFSGIGGTRNCEWLFTDHAVLLDTAGRYTTQDSHQQIDQAEWLGFLDLLTKHRPRQPINGVLVTFSFSDLLKQTHAEQRIQAQEIRKRVMELYEKLGMRIPIYMLFTKCDLIAGFTEFFADLGDEAIKQVWGMTFPEENAELSVSVFDHFGKSYDDLIHRIDNRLLQRIQKARDIKQRDLVFAFPQELATLKESILQFLQESFKKTSYDKNTPLLRGCYFTSATQDGNPIDRVMTILAKSFNLQRESTEIAGRPGKSYFITHLLKKVIFPEAKLAGTNSKIEQKRRWLERGTYAGAIAVVIGMISLWSISLTQNQISVTKQQGKIDNFRIAQKTKPNWSSDISSLLPRLNALYQARNVFPESTPWIMGGGLSQADKLRSTADEAYRSVLENSFLPAIQYNLEQRIRNLDRGSKEKLYQLLKVYLMLGDFEKMKEHHNLAIALKFEHWEKKYTDQPDVQDQLLIHTKNLLAQRVEVKALDDKLIALARQKLKHIPMAEQIYTRIKSNASNDNRFDFHPIRAMGYNSNQVFEMANESKEQLKIPGLFTQNGFTQIFKKESTKLAESTMADDWVLGRENQPTRAEIDQLRQGLERLYFDDYIRHWNGVLKNTQIKPIENLTQALDLLEYISGVDSPMRKLLIAVEQNTSLTGAKGLVSKAINKLEDKGDAGWFDKASSLLGKSDNKAITQPKSGLQVEQQFDRLNNQVRGESPPIQGVLIKLNDLRSYLSNIGSDSDGDSALKVAINRMNQGSEDIISRIRSESSNAPDPIKRWLNSIVVGTWKVILIKARAKINKAWENEVLPHYQQGINGRYPVFSNSETEVTLTDFGRFFAPKGIIDEFFSDYLKPFVVTGRNNWKLKYFDQQSIGITDTALRQFKYASTIRDLFFRNTPDNPSVSFKLKPVHMSANLRSAYLNFEGQSIFFRHDHHEFKSFVWPGSDENGIASIVLTSLSGKETNPLSEVGPWVWFRTLDKSIMETTGQDEKFLIKFNFSGREIHYKLFANSVVNPFKFKGLKSFRCPSQL